MNTKRNIAACAIAIFGTVLLSGCATTAEISAETGSIVESQWNQLEESEVCCAEFQRADFVPVSREGAEISIEPGKSRIFETGKSYFRGVQVAALSGARLVVVKSHQNLPRRNGLPYIVRPSYVVVDEDLQIISGAVDIPLCYAQGWGKRETGYFGVVKLDPAAAWGLVFHTSSSSRGTYVSYGGDATTAGGGAVVSMSVNYSFPASPVGLLEILPLTEEMTSYFEKKCPFLLD